MTGFPKPPPELAALCDPRLDGAACAGKAPLFDARGKHESLLDADYRHDRAKAICRRCPVVAACRQALLELPQAERSGIWAGLDAHYISTRLNSEKDIAA
ncbi:WhiB family transcriptional regulator [Corynebacterium pacaense]|uniref:WhiB family transcriptional regulator n=1 Tax=Corynebacterium pacaense TaxID=1816684 RepID=UPI0009BA4BDF